MEILEQIQSILAESFGLSVDEITPDARLALRCDEEFGVDIEDEDIHRLITVGDVARYIEEKQ